MKSFKRYIAEVSEPRSKEEKKFKAQHEVEVVTHPVAEPSQHTGEIQKSRKKRIADQEGDANYDKSYTKKDDDGVKLESVEEELSPKQKKIDHNKNGKIDGHDLAMIRAKKKNESVELDEAFKQGVIKLNDKSSIVLKQEDAEALNKMFKKMSPGSKKKMQEDAMKDKKGFAEILDFAKSAEQ